MDVQVPDKVDLRKYIEVRIFGERPHIRGRRIPVATIVKFMETEGWTVQQAAYEFTLSEAEVLSAMLYYEEHKAEIEAQEEAYQEQLDEAHQKYNGTV